MEDYIKELGKHIESIEVHIEVSELEISRLETNMEFENKQLTLHKKNLVNAHSALEVAKGRLQTESQQHE